MCFIHCTSSCSGKFVIMSSSRLVARLATVQTLCSLTHQVHELHRLDWIGDPHHVFLSTQSTSLYFVMVSCKSELRRFVSVSSNVHFHLALTSETEWSPRHDHQPARTWLRTDVTPRLHLLEGLLDVSNTCNRRLSRTLPAAFV